MNSIDGLLPCPFCGESDLSTPSGKTTLGATYQAFVRCECGAQGPSYIAAPNALAVTGAREAWNTRTPAPSLGEDVVEALTEALVKGTRLDISYEEAEEAARAALTAMRPVQEEGVGEDVAALKAVMEAAMDFQGTVVLWSDYGGPALSPEVRASMDRLWDAFKRADAFGPEDNPHPDASPPSLGVEELRLVEAAIIDDLRRVAPLSGSTIDVDDEAGVVSFDGSFRPVEIAIAVLAKLREALSRVSGRSEA